ncbi:MAG: SdrD B-like domain-containing protein [Caldilineaceae bacterium]
MKIQFRPLLYCAVFGLLLTLASYAQAAKVVGQTVPTGQITVTKEHLQHSLKSFRFEIEPGDDGRELHFWLQDGESNTVNVVPGVYTIHEEELGANVLVNIDCGSGGTVPGGTTPGGTVPPGDIDLHRQKVKVTVTSDSAIHCTFQNSRAARLRIRVYNDVNSNGTRNAGEKYLKNWAVTVFDSTGQTKVAGPKKTNRYGRVKFESLLPGDYIVCENVKTRWVNTQPGGNSPCYAVTLAAGQEAKLLFGNHKTPKDEDNDEDLVQTSDADMAVDPALADGIEIVDNPDEVYGPEWDDAPDATLVYNIFIPYAGH